MNSRLLPVLALSTLAILVAPSLCAQALIVTGTTTLPEDTTATYSSITVESGGVLEIGGGSTITVTGALAIDAGGTVLCRGKNTTAQVGGEWAGTGVTLQAGSVTIAATGKLSADGQGYPNGSGPGFTGAPGDYNLGAAHGGTGLSTSIVVALVHGSLLQPVSPGSSGGRWSAADATAGGGAIRLIVSGTLALDGEISADGTGSGTYHAGGAGGSLWVTTQTLTGAGKFTADASVRSNSAGACSGGRVAVHYAGGAAFTGFATSTALATPGSAAENGTVAFVDTSVADGHLRVYQRADFAAGSTVQFGAVTAEAGGLIRIGGGSTFTVNGALTVTGSGTILCQGVNTTAQVGGAWAGSGVTVNAGSVAVAAGGLISADGQGYRNGAGPGHSGSASDYQRGASHGGAGLASEAPYGVALEPVTPGSSGGRWSANDATAGGGAIRLVVAGTFVLDGEISADGAGSGTYHAGGAGGSIWVTTQTLSGAGRFTADASVRSNSAAACSGGRIAVYYASASGFSGFTTSSADPTPGTTAEPGTVGFLDTSVTDRHLRVFQRWRVEPDTAARFGRVSLDDAALFELGGGSTLRALETIAVQGASRIRVESSRTAAKVDGAWVGVGGRIHAHTVTVSADSLITADGQGYRNGAGPGFASSTERNYHMGASHGGLGAPASGQPVAPVYGSFLRPAEPGSAGGVFGSEQTAGGGAIQLVVDDLLTLDGEVTADGTGEGTYHGGATGGSVWVDVNRLRGSGRFTADARASSNSQGQSAGGRVAVHYRDAAGFGGFTSSSVSPGGASAQPGSIVFIDQSVPGGALRVTQRLAVADGTTATFGALTIEQGALFELGGGAALDIEGALTIDGNSTLLVHAVNRTAPVSGAWIGTGGTIAAGSLHVGAGSKITADGEGYVNGAGPGFFSATERNYHMGASHGGLGAPASGQPIRAPYGSSLEPVALGSSGGSWSAGDPTAGGGAIRIIVDGTLTLDGEITADGTASGTYVGGACGGSIWVTTGRLAGSGKFTADAFPSRNSQGQSAGGRIAVHHAGAGTFTGFATSTALRGGPTADHGTVIFLETTDDGLDGRVFTRFAVEEFATLQLHALTLEEGSLLDLRGGSTLRIAGLFDVKDDAIVNLLGANRTGVSGGWAGVGTHIDAGEMHVAFDALLDADGEGYLNAAGPGGVTGDRDYQTGASHGGRGGGARAAEPYGSEMAPRQLGSAGGRFGSETTAGGGAVFINVARTLRLDGELTADGIASGTYHGGAAGGSVLIRAGTLTGFGTVSARGSAGSNNGGMHSAGGRIAVWAGTLDMAENAFDAASGGSGAGPGTVHFADSRSIAWIDPIEDVIVGHARLAWIAAPAEAAAIGVDIELQPLGGPAVTLGAGLAAESELIWDSTATADGAYTLTARSRHSRTGEILGTASRAVQVINNSLVLRGAVAGNITIPAGRVTYVFGTVTIPAGATVTVEPGAIVKVAPGGAIVVQTGGSLVALGTEAAPILFTSLLDDTAGGDSNYDGTATEPGPADWNGLRNRGGTLTLNEHASTRHAVEISRGAIVSAVRWRAGAPRVVSENIEIGSGGSLTIEAGAVVKFAPGTGIMINGGSLATEGTLLRPVILTSERDDTVAGDSNSDGSLTAPAAGDWLGIYFSGSDGTLNHTRILYAGGSTSGTWANSGAVRASAGTVTLNSCTIADARFDGVIPSESNALITLNNCLVLRADRGIHARPGSAAVVRHCVFDGNRQALHYHGGRIDVTNTAVTNSLDWGVVTDLSAVTDFVANALWNPKARGGDSTSPAIVVGQNGVLRADPQFVDRAAQDYRLLAGSALIDAGRTIGGLAADRRGFARLGAAPEIGAYEFTGGAAAPIDLQAQFTDVPATVVSGENASLAITALNTGSTPVTGPWVHEIFLRPESGGDDVPVTGLVDFPAGTPAPGDGATFTATVRVPDGLVGAYRWGVTVNPREDVFEGANLDNNTALASAPTRCDVPELPFGGMVRGRFTRAGEARTYKVRPAVPGQTIHLLADADAEAGWTQLFVARGRVPTAFDFDERSPQWNAPDALLSVAGTADAWHYVRVQATEIRVPNTAWSLAARAVEFQLSGVGLGVVGTGRVTVNVLGTDLRSGAAVSLRPASGAGPISASGVTVTGGTSADASFDLSGAAAGLYDVVVVQDGIERVLRGGLRVAPAGGSPGIITTVAGPGAGRTGFPYFASITARNAGTVDAPAPIITVTGPGLPVDLNDPANPFSGFGLVEEGGRPRDFFLAIPPTGDPSVLPAGRSAEAFIAQGIFPAGNFAVTTRIITAEDTTPYDIAALGDFLAPDPRPAGWDEAWALVSSSQPQTLGGLARLTATAAGALFHERGLRSNDVEQLLAAYVDAVHTATLSQVRGRVRWLDTGGQRPLEGIRVSLVGADLGVAAATETRRDGTFVIPSLAAGTYAWNIEGALPAEVFPELTIEMGSTISGITLPLLPGASARLGIVPARDVDFDEVAVSLFSPRLGLGFPAAPDPLGNVTFRGLPPADYTLTIAAPDRMPIVREGLSIALDDANDLGSFAFGPGGTLAGRVTRADTSAPLAGAIVSLLGDDGAATRTAADGSYELGPVPAGTHAVRVRSTGFAARTEAGVVLASGGAATLDVALQRGAAVSGAVHGASGPLADVTVRASLGGVFLGEAVTGADGAYTIADLPAGNLTLEVEHGVYANTSVPVTLTAGATTSAGTTTLALSSRITGRVRTAAGAAVPAVVVRLERADGEFLTTASGTDGRFLFAGVPAGTHEVSLVDGSARKSVTVAATVGSLNEVDLTLDAGAITGRLAAARSGAPVLGMVALLRDGRLAATTATDLTGTFTLWQVKPGAGSIVAWTSDADFGPLLAEVTTGATTDLGTLALPTGAIAVSIASRPALGQDDDTRASATLVRRLEDGRDFSRRDFTFATDATVTIPALAPGRYWLLVETALASSGWVPVDVAATPVNAAVTLRASGLATGLVRTSDTTPLEGAEVTFVDTTNRALRHRTLTDSSGRYALPLPTGTYELWAGAPWRTPGLAGRRVGTVNVAAIATVETHVTLAAATVTISGRVATADGGAPAGGEVFVLTADRAILAAGSLDPDGNYTLPLPEAGTCQLEARATGYTTPLTSFTAAGAAIANVAITATWCGGIDLPPPSLATRPPQAMGLVVEPDKDGGAIRPQFFGGIDLNNIMASLEALRTWIAENVFGRPPPSEPSLPGRPPGLNDPDCPCPEAQARWRDALRHQLIAERKHSEWVRIWENQVDTIAGLTRDFGINLGKLAISLYTKGMSDRLESAAENADKFREAYKISQASFDRMADAYDAAVKSGKVAPDALATMGNQLRIMEQNFDNMRSAEAALVPLRQAMSKIGLGVTATAGGIQLTGTDPMGGNPFTGLLKDLTELPTVLGDAERMKGLVDNLSGWLQAAEAIQLLSADPRLRGNPYLAKLGEISDKISVVVSTVKLVQGIIDNMNILENAKADYYDELIMRDRAYQLCLRALTECRKDCDRDDPDRPKPPKPPGGRPGGDGGGNGGGSIDPNAKYTIGYGDAGWVRPDEPLIYTITFENLATADLPAQRVVVTDQLDSRLDWSTFELLACGFNRTTVAIPSGLQRYTTRAAVDTDPNPVRCDLRLNPATGLFTVDLRSVDAITGGFPRDTLAGFLPPNDAQHRGEGFVTFMIRPKASQPDGTQVRNLASIVFDTNDAILTNETVNTLDRTPPRGRVTTLAQRSGSSFLVSWSASDLGSGAVAYTIWVSRNNGPWERWLTDVSSTSATFDGANGSVYRFFATARDAVGWSDTPSYAADTSTLVGLGSRLANISTRGVNGTGNDAMIVGFVIAPGSSPSTPKNLLLRGVGPTLGAFGVSGALADPRLDLFNSAGAVVTANDDWGQAANAALLPPTFARVGAFGFESGTKDSALLLELAPGIFTARVSGAANATGVALVEAYDADLSLSDDTAPRLMNLSTRGFVGTGDELIIAGFVITGDTPKSLLIRAVGPTLGVDPFNLPGVIADPRIRLADASGATVFDNDDWSVSPDPTLITEISQRVGAFGLPAGSRDAVMVVSLPPGSYTALVSGNNDGTGLVIVELYDADF